MDWFPQATLLYYHVVFALLSISLPRASPCQLHSVLPARTVYMDRGYVQPRLNHSCELQLEIFLSNGHPGVIQRPKRDGNGICAILQNAWLDRVLLCSQNERLHCTAAAEYSLVVAAPDPQLVYPSSNH